MAPTIPGDRQMTSLFTIHTFRNEAGAWVCNLMLSNERIAQRIVADVQDGIDQLRKEFIIVGDIRVTRGRDLI